MKTPSSTRLGRLSRALPITALLLTALGPAVASAQAASYALSVSAGSSRASASALQGRSLSGSAYVFTAAASDLRGANPAGVAKVCFWLDDIGMSGTARRCEAATPFDFAGSTNSSSSSPALSWDTLGVKNGTHTITQLVTRTGGATEVDTAMFAVVNVPAVESLGVSPASVTGGWPSTGTVTLAAASPAGGTSVSLTSSSSAAQLPASVIVPAGSTSTTFAITTSVVSSTTTAVIAGASIGAAASTSLTLTAAVPVGPVGPAYTLSVSSASGRTGARELQGQALAGMAYVYTSSLASPLAPNPAGIGKVCFWLDDQAMSGSATRCEAGSPYDFAGSVSSLASSPALPWDTTRVVDGAHNVTQLVTMSNGTSEIDSDDFTVRNLVQAIAVAITPSPAATTPGGTVGFQAAVTGTTTGQSTAVTWSVPAGGGTIGGATGVYVAPATAGTFVVTATSVADTSRKASATVLVAAAATGDLARLKALSTKRIYFQHASMGGEACGVYSPGIFTGVWGLNKIITNNPGSGTRLATTVNTAAAIPAGTVGEWTHGALNGQPLQKLQYFDAAVRGGLGGAMDVVMFKIGNVDFDQVGNLVGTGGAPVATWFATNYKPVMDALQAAYPNTRIIHVTSPVQKASAYWGNTTIQAWNQLLRTNYPGRVFDFAYWASVTAAGQSSQLSADGAPCMADAWNIPTDGHLNQAGADWMGEQLLAFLAGLP